MLDPLGLVDFDAENVADDLESDADEFVRGDSWAAQYIRNQDNNVVLRFGVSIKENDLPPVVFHSLRHSSITYKLKLNGGDIKSVQGDSGHAQVKMVTDVYSHILDEDRRLNAQRFEETFYQQKTPLESPISVTGQPQTVQPDTAQQSINDETMLNYMLEHPEFIKKFKALLNMGN